MNPRQTGGDEGFAQMQIARIDIGEAAAVAIDRSTQPVAPLAVAPVDVRPGPVTDEPVPASSPPVDVVAAAA